MTVPKREVRNYCERLMWRFIWSGSLALGFAIGLQGDVIRWVLQLAGCLFSAAIAAYIVGERFR